MVQDDDEIKNNDDAEIEENPAELEEIEIPEGELQDDKEPDFVPSAISSSFADDTHEEEEDPYEAFNTPVKQDVSQLDPYGVGAPDGFEEEGEEEEEEDDLEAESTESF